MLASPSTPASASMNEFTRRRAIFFCFGGPPLCPPARNHRRQTPGVYGVVATLVAPFQLYLISLGGGKMAAIERLLNSARRVPVRVAQAFQ